MRTSRQYLRDLLANIETIETFTREGESEFRSDLKTQFAVIRAYEIMGEIVKRLPYDLLAQQPQIEWQDIKEFRDFLAHNYDRVQLKIVWGAVQKLPELKTAVLALIAALPEDPGT